MISALAGGEWSALHPSCFTARERAPGIHLIGELQSQSGRGGEEKKSQPLPGLNPQSFITVGVYILNTL